jgi:hypothetical protein
MDHVGEGREYWVYGAGNGVPNEGGGEHIYNIVIVSACRYPSLLLRPCEEWAPADCSAKNVKECVLFVILEL